MRRGKLYMVRFRHFVDVNRLQLFDMGQELPAKIRHLGVLPFCLLLKIPQKVLSNSRLI